MMYKQSIENIQLVIIPLDGTIFDLNRYRYNYTHHFCESHKLQYSLDDFYHHLSNMYDMYHNTPIQQVMSEGLFNAKIEREMLQYLTYKGLKPKEGFLELVEYLHQKNIPVAIISTHRSKDAKKYLSMANIVRKVDYIIGSDMISMPLPSTEILENVIEHFQIKPENTLVISSFEALNKASNRLHMNVIFCEDLKSAGTYEKETSYQTCHNFFEVFNTLLFDRYNEIDMYSALLGMNKHMSKKELDQVKDKWENDYPDDSQLNQIVHQTYAYHLSHLNEPVVKDGSVYMQKTHPRKTFHFDDEEVEQEPEISIQTQETTSNEKPDEPMKTKTFSALNAQEEEELTALLSQINYKKKSPPVIETEDEEFTNLSEDEEEWDEKSSFSWLDIIFNLIYIIATSFLIIFIGIIVYIAFIPQFENQEHIFHILTLIFQGYYAMVESCFRVFFNSLHTLIPMIPDYQNYLIHNQMFSLDGVQLFNIFIFQIILISFIKIIIYILRRDSDNENHTS